MSDDFYVWYFKKYCDWTRGNYGDSVRNAQHRGGPGFEDRFKEDARVDGCVAFAMEHKAIQRTRMETYQKHVTAVVRKGVREGRDVRKWFKENCL